MYKSFGDHTTSGGTAEGLFNADGTPQALKLASLTRTYQHAFQGTPLQMYFNTADASFTSTFVVDASITAPGEIYIYFDLHYSGENYVASATCEGKAVEGGVTFKKSEQQNYLTVEFGTPAAVDKKIV